MHSRHNCQVTISFSCSFYGSKCNFLKNKAFFKLDVGHLVDKTFNTLLCAKTETKRNYRKWKWQEIGETKREIETYKDRHCKTKRGGCK